MKILRDNLAAELRELRTYPDHVTLAEFLVSQDMGIRDKFCGARILGDIITHIFVEVIL